MFSYAEKFFPNKLFSCYFAPKYNCKKKIYFLKLELPLRYFITSLIIIVIIVIIIIIIIIIITIIIIRNNMIHI